MDLQALQTTLRQFAAERDWQPFHTPKNLASALVVEAAELAEIFQWMTPEQSQAVRGDAVVSERVGEELADVLLYLLQLADHSGVDLKRAVGRKLVKNARKHPPLHPGRPAGPAWQIERETHVLLDYENVQPGEAELRALVPEMTDLWLFHGLHQKGLAERYASLGQRLMLVPISQRGKNSLDFHLSFYLGYVAARHPDAQLVVVANDKGYEPMVVHAQALGFATRQLGHARAPGRKTTPRRAASTTSPKAAPKTRPKAAPRTRSKAASATPPAAPSATPAVVGKPARPARPPRPAKPPVAEAAQAAAATAPARKDRARAPAAASAPDAPPSPKSASLPANRGSRAAASPPAKRAPGSAPHKRATATTAERAARGAESAERQAAAPAPARPRTARQASSRTPAPNPPSARPAPAPTARTDAAPASAARLGEALRRMGSRRPRTLGSLHRLLASLLGVSADAAQVRSAIAALQAAGSLVASEAGTVSYRL